MSKTVGDIINPIIQKQIQIRQKAHGLGSSPLDPRSPESHSYLNSKTSWVKMASGVNITAERLKKEGLKEGFSWEGLAKYAVLFGGLSRLEDTTLIHRGDTDGKNNIWDYYDGSYNVNASFTTQETSEFGLVPMPGIESVDVKCLNRGSIKEANVKIKCYSPEQFQIIDLLYLRIGYTMFIEWGWSPYLNNDNELIADYHTLIEQKEWGFFDKKWQDKSHRGFLRALEKYRNTRHGNYDGLLCKVTNFSWDFNANGSYDITIRLISLGDVIESLKTNVIPNNGLYKIINEKYKLFAGEEVDLDDEPENDRPPGPIDNYISAYFFINKLLLYENREQSGKEYWKRRDITCKAGGSDLDIFGVFIDANNLEDKIIETEPNEQSVWLWDLKDKIEELEKNGYKPTTANEIQKENALSKGNWYAVEPDGWDLLLKNPIDNLQDIGLSLASGVVGIDTESAVKPTLYTKIVLDSTSEIEGQGKKDMVYLHWNSGEDDEDKINDAGFYVRFGHLLDLINKKIIPKDSKSKSSIIKINADQWGNRMYLFPYQAAMEPRVCIFNSGKDEPVNSKIYYQTLPAFKNLDKGYAWTMNLYLSCQKVNDLISNNMDEKGRLDLYSFLENACTELNAALGGVNNLEPFVDETTNTINIIDGSYSVPQKTEYSLELFGYNSNNPYQQGDVVSNFVKEFSIKTELTNDFATMATVGATAGGYTKGTENTMFSKWNKGLIDMFKEKLIPPDKKDQEETPAETYYDQFWMQRYPSFGLTAPLDVENDVYTGDIPNILSDACDKNVALVSEFYRYCQSKIQEKRDKEIENTNKPGYGSPSNGFIPISLSFTMDGISGIKIYNEIKVNTRFLPKNYPENLRFIIKGVDHSISKNDWTTKIETVVITNNTDENGKPIFTYQELKDIVYNAIVEGKETNGGTSTTTGVAGAVANAIANAPSTKQTGAKAEKAAGKGYKTYGTLGENGNKKELSADALTLDAINNLVNTSGAQNGGKYASTIRQRIVKVAASYVGNQEALPPQNPGWWDEDYEAKFKQLKSSPWTKTQPWCAWFCQLVWKEAYTVGNKLVPSIDTLEYAKFYKDTWKNRLQNGATIGAGAWTCGNNFKAFGKFITLDQAISGKYIPEPGDIAVYEYGHVDLVIKPFIEGGKLAGFSAIGGNTGNADARNGGETKYYAKKRIQSADVRGFCKVITPFNKDKKYV